MKNRELVVVLDNIRSAYNVGAIFRTCDGAGVKRLYLCGITPYPPHKKILKTALGAEEYVDWEQDKSTISTLKKLKKNGFEILAIEQTDKSISYNTVNYPQKVAIIFGNEITGVSSEVLSESDSHIELPMKGEKRSLNVATTVGIISYYLKFTAE